MEYMYRYDDVRYSRGVDERDDALPGYCLRVELRKYTVISRTAKGVWIDAWGVARKFVLLTARKRFACPTEEEALVSYRKRKESQISLLRNQLESAEQALKLADNLNGSYYKF